MKNNITRTLLGSVAFVAVLCALIALPSPVSAGVHSWYTPGDPPAGYLDARDTNNNLLHILNNTDGVVSDINATTPGDYCNAYKTNSPLQYPNNQSAFTGFNPGTPYSDWQEGDSGSNNICQARQGTWGFKLSGATNNNCSPNIVCGMHHFARLSNGDNNRPWSDSFGTAPAAALSFKATASPYNATGNTVGYICPLLKDVTTNNYIELCMVEWQKGSGFPGVTEASNGVTCASPSNWSVDTVWTTFEDSRSWATRRAGSAGTFAFVSPASANFSATISAQNLQAVINKINQPAPQPGGCGRGLSTDVRDYAFIGFEHGVEGGGYTALGASVTNERFSTTTDALFAGDKLLAGQSVYSASDTYRLVMQTDGNLVLYPLTGGSQGAAVWASNTSGTASPYLVMQADGNLVIYNGSTTPHTPVWSTASSNGGSYFTVQDDGNTVVYKGATPQWARF